jgi:2-dehydro-3-deoxyphosphogluconate aldolase/(4S)-4-hydroxy-2-oxoglutarate aldolase
MRSRNQIQSDIKFLGLIAVVRTERADQIIPLSEALVAGGVRALELTMTIPDPITVVQNVTKHFGMNAIIGMGSLLDAKMAKAAADAGAEFLVTPITKLDVVAVGRAMNRPVMIGAYTATEAQLAHDSGADFVKIFPADVLGPDYIKALRAPMPHLRIVPTGGITLHNVADYFRVGCLAVGAGSALVAPDLIAAGDWAGLTNRAKDFTAAVNKARGK